MKKIILPFLALCGAVFAADTKVDSPVTVKFNDSEKFADFKDDSFNSEKGRASLEQLLTEHLQTAAKRRLAPGQKLEVTFNDIDLAGDFEPHRTPPADNIRIVKDIYPPRAKLQFRLLDASGAVVKEGERTLSDLGFTMNLTFPPSDPLRFDKQMLTDWVQREFAAPKKA